MNKNLKINDKAHKLLKIFCAEHNQKINEVASEILIKHLENLNESKTLPKSN